MKRSAKTFLFLAIICSMVFGSWMAVRIVQAVQFNFNCEAYLTRAANANTIELAKVELAKAVNYAEQNNLTEGIVSIFLKNPANDIGFWYRNMKSAYEELEALPDDASALEKTNVLMKLRESITTDDGNGTSVIVPDGIEIYPANVPYFWWGMLSILATSVFWTLFSVSLTKKK
jgi:ABC-type dipeptide/oligopeptide/nickel transport system permease component